MCFDRVKELMVGTINVIASVHHHVAAYVL